MPEGWDLLRLGSVARMLVPMRDKPTDLEGAIPWIRIEDIAGKYVYESTSSQGVSPETIRRMNLKVFPVGTVLCTCSCSMGATAIAARPLVTNQTFIGIVPSPRLVPDYLFYLMQASSEHLAAHATGAIQQYLSRSDFEQLRLPGPPISVQRAIAAFLDRKTAAIDALIAKKERLIELLQEKRQALITQAVTKGLDPDVPMKESGVDWLGRIPAHWRTVPVRFVSLTIQTGTTPPTDQPTYFEDADIPWYGPGSFGPALEVGSPTRFVNQVAIRDGKVKPLPSGTVAVVTIGATVGRVAMLKRLGTTNQQVTGIVFNPRIVHERFAGFQFKRLESVLRGLASVTTLPILDQAELASVPVVVAPLPEQAAIAERLDSELQRIDIVISKQAESIARIHDFRQTLISAAVTGKIEVPTEEAA